MAKYLDKTGLTNLWNKIKDKFQLKLVSGTNIKTVDNQSIVGSGNINLSSTYYTKTEIDNKIGDVNSLLDTINGEVI